MIYIRVRAVAETDRTPNRAAATHRATLFVHGVAEDEFFADGPDYTLRRAWALWGTHLPAFIRPEAPP